MGLIYYPKKHAMIAYLFLSSWGHCYPVQAQARRRWWISVFQYQHHCPSHVFRTGYTFILSTCKRILKACILSSARCFSSQRPRKGNTSAFLTQEEFKNVRMSRVRQRRFYFECVWGEECSGFTHWVQVHQLITEERWSSAGRARHWRSWKPSATWVRSVDMRYKAADSELQDCAQGHLIVFSEISPSSVGGL